MPIQVTLSLQNKEISLSLPRHLPSPRPTAEDQKSFEVSANNDFGIGLLTTISASRFHHISPMRGTASQSITNQPIEEKPSPLELNPTAPPAVPEETTQNNFRRNLANWICSAYTFSELYQIILISRHRTLLNDIPEFSTVADNPVLSLLTTKALIQKITTASIFCDLWQLFLSTRPFRKAEILQLMKDANDAFGPQVSQNDEIEYHIKAAIDAILDWIDRCRNAPDPTNPWSFHHTWSQNQNATNFLTRLLGASDRKSFLRNEIIQDISTDHEIDNLIPTLLDLLNDVPTLETSPHKPPSLATHDGFTALIELDDERLEQLLRNMNFPHNEPSSQFLQTLFLHLPESEQDRFLVHLITLYVAHPTQKIWGDTLRFFRPDFTCYSWAIFVLNLKWAQTTSDAEILVRASSFAFMMADILESEFNEVLFLNSHATGYADNELDELAALFLKETGGLYEFLSKIAPAQDEISPELMAAFDKIHVQNSPANFIKKRLEYITAQSFSKTALLLIDKGYGPTAAKYLKKFPPDPQLSLAFFLDAMKKGYSIPWDLPIAHTERNWADEINFVFHQDPHARSSITALQERLLRQRDFIRLWEIDEKCGIPFPVPYEQALLELIDTDWIQRAKELASLILKRGYALDHDLVILINSRAQAIFNSPPMVRRPVSISDKTVLLGDEIIRFYCTYGLLAEAEELLNQIPAGPNGHELRHQIQSWIKEERASLTQSMTWVKEYLLHAVISEMQHQWWLKDSSNDILLADNDNSLKILSHSSTEIILNYLQSAAFRFCHPKWPCSYAGPKWAKIAETAYELWSRPTDDALFWIDRAFDLQHNNGTVFDKWLSKVILGSKETSVLDFKFRSKNFQEFLKFLSEENFTPPDDVVKLRATITDFEYKTRLPPPFFENVVPWDYRIGETIIGIPAAASPDGDFVSGLVSFRDGDWRPGNILICPYTTPDDLELILSAKGIVTTQGGLLSHAAITARELGKSAIILTSATWHEDDRGGYLSATDNTGNNLVIREGDMLRLFGKTGTIEVVNAVELNPELVTKYLFEESLWNASHDDRLIAAERLGRLSENAREKHLQEKWGAIFLEFIAHRFQSQILQEIDLVRLEALRKKTLKEVLFLSDFVREETALQFTQEVETSYQQRAKSIQETMPAIRSKKISALNGFPKQNAISNTTPGKEIYTLIEVQDADTPWIGGKCAKSGALKRMSMFLRFRTPNGFGMSRIAYEKTLNESGIMGFIETLAQRLDQLDDDAFKNQAPAISRRIRSLIMSSELPEPLRESVTTCLRGLNTSRGFAVRSSAVQEDGGNDAFAGAAESFLNVKLEDVIEQIKAVWASFWLDRGILYRRRRGIPNAGFSPAVLIQEMAPEADASGVIFTKNPATGRMDEVVINAAFGWGEGVVNGSVPSDTYIFNTDRGEESLVTITNKESKIASSQNGGTVVANVSFEARNERALPQNQVKELADIARNIEAKYGYPVDIEFCVANGEIFLLQVRPITV